MKRKVAFLLALVMLVCVCFTACGDDTKSKKEALEGLKEGLQDGILMPTDPFQVLPMGSIHHNIEVPRSIGKMYPAEIEGALGYTEFVLEIKWEDANNPDIKKGEVFKQDPAAGTKVEPGTTVTLYVNNATPNISLDANAVIEGAHKNDVRKLLQDAGFVVKEVVASSETIPADHVISININKGQAYPYGTEVTMVVSTGASTPPPIDFPAEIVGEKKEVAASILKSRGFTGTITFVEQNYTEDAYKEKGIVMGVIVNGVLQETLPEEITADGVLTLAVSSGLKSVVVELEWPKDENGAHLNMSLNVNVVVNGIPNETLTQKYAPSYNPSFNESKLTFVLNSHPSEAEYYVSVNLKEASASIFKEYARLLINPVTGTWTMVGGYQPIFGITE